ncbi:MAG: hypothetical protein HYU66_13300 [Armatimonadetes bacterium]|nr:hypothetical protein [Armatimonadota bacterium]
MDDRERSQPQAIEGRVATRQESKPRRMPWKPPTATRVEVRRTLGSPGTAIDAFSGSLPT